jgi:hypothetical protein
MPIIHVTRAANRLPAPIAPRTLLCPELSRAAYKKMFNIDYDHPASSDSLGDPPSSKGLGTAPVLRRGHIYQLRVVDREHMLVINETAELYGILLAVDSL